MPSAPLALLMYVCILIVSSEMDASGGLSKTTYPFWPPLFGVRRTYVETRAATPERVAWAQSEVKSQLIWLVMIGSEGGEGRAGGGLRGDGKGGQQLEHDPEQVGHAEQYPQRFGTHIPTGPP